MYIRSTYMRTYACWYVSFYCRNTHVVHFPCFDINYVAIIIHQFLGLPDMVDEDWKKYVSGPPGFTPEAMYTI